MFKILVVPALVLAFANSSFAGECVDKKGKDITQTPEVFQQLISEAGSCYEASDLAKACAWGSSLDVSTAGAAYDVCHKELTTAKPSKELTDLLTKMTSLCGQKYRNEEGTLYRSMHAYCNLSALVWVVNLANPE